MCHAVAEERDKPGRAMRGVLSGSTMLQQDDPEVQYQYLS